jgi:hypothetical protein
MITARKKNLQRIVEAKKINATGYFFMSLLIKNKQNSKTLLMQQLMAFLIVRGKQKYCVCRLLD